MKTYYNQLIESGKIKPDEAQSTMAKKLHELKLQLEAYAAPKKFLRKAAPKPMGLFIHGKVGRGKSMLMDGFYSRVNTEQKKRVHFHEFMQGIHARLHELRSQVIGDGQQVVERVAQDFTKNLKLLCFDEYEVNDVTNAMILSKLFKAMSEQGVVFVITSNKVPEDHYTNGLQRQSYLDFCNYLRTVVAVESLDSKRDYRMIQQSMAENYFVPAGYEGTQKLKEKFKSMSAEHLDKCEIEVHGHKLELRAAGKIAWAEFADLCAKNFGTADFLAIAKRFDVLFLENVPAMHEENRNEARRFINLVDILYENKVMLVISAAAEPDKLYTEATSGAFEFNRTASRLTEMRGWRHKRDSEERF